MEVPNAQEPTRTIVIDCQTERLDEAASFLASALGRAAGPLTDPQNANYRDLAGRAMSTGHPLRCSCGKVRGHIQLPATTGRAVCYCKDCQAFAHFLQRAGDVLDEAGGTDIIATMPAQVHIEQGFDAVQCMSLSERGLLRWYASCCKTPIGNTPRDHKTPYIGLVHNCLSAQPLEPSFGPLKVRINTHSAHRPVKSTPLASFLVVMKLMSTMIPARWRGAYRDNPFFDAASGAPIKQPQVLSAAQRSQLRPASAD